jgi:hypothetical protein
MSLFIHRSTDTAAGELTVTLLLYDGVTHVICVSDIYVAGCNVIFWNRHDNPVFCIKLLPYSVISVAPLTVPLVGYMYDSVGNGKY